MPAIKTKQNIPTETLKIILQEVRSLRRDLSLVLPQEDLKDFSRPTRIKHSYKKALKTYAPDETWK